MERRDLNRSERNYSVDLQRIILMIFIISHHAMVNAFGLSNLKYESPLPVDYNSVGFFLLNGFCIIAVNAFFFISGYFRIKKNTNKLIFLYIECMFYMSIWQILSALIYDSKIDFFLMLFPIKDYWFMAVYFCIALLAPFVSSLISHLSDKECRDFLCITTIVNTVYGFLLDIGEIGDGYSVFQGLYMYSFGYIVRRFIETNKPKRIICLISYIMCSIIVGGGAYYLSSSSRYGWAWKFFSYNNPLVVLGAVSFCLVFVGGNLVHNKRFQIVLFELSSVSLAAYLITDCYVYKKKIFIPLLEFSNGQSIIVCLFAILIYAVLLYLICFCIEKTRKFLESKIFSTLKI